MAYQPMPGGGWMGGLEPAAPLPPRTKRYPGEPDVDPGGYIPTDEERAAERARMDQWYAANGIPPPDPNTAGRVRTGDGGGGSIPTMDWRTGTSAGGLGALQTPWTPEEAMRQIGADGQLPGYHDPGWYPVERPSGPPATHDIYGTPLTPGGPASSPPAQTGLPSDAEREQMRAALMTPGTRGAVGMGQQPVRLYERGGGGSGYGMGGLASGAGRAIGGMFGLGGGQGTSGGAGWFGGRQSGASAGWGTTTGEGWGQRGGRQSGAGGYSMTRQSPTGNSPTLGGFAGSGYGRRY